MFIKRSPDSVLQGFVDRRDLATIVPWMHEHKMYPRNKSELLRYIVETFAQLLIDNGAEWIKDTGEANEVLARAGLVGFNSQGRLHKTFEHNLELDKLDIERPEHDVLPRMKKEEKIAQGRKTNVNNKHNLNDWSDEHIKKGQEALRKLHDPQFRTANIIKDRMSRAIGGIPTKEERDEEEAQRDRDLIESFKSGPWANKEK